MINLLIFILQITPIIGVGYLLQVIFLKNESNEFKL